MQKNKINLDIKKSSDVWLLSSIILFFSIILPSPIITYGTQLVFLGFISTFIYLSNNSVKIRSLIVTLSLISFILVWTSIQSFFLLHQELIWLQTMRVCFWIICSYFIFEKISRFNNDTYIKSIRIVILILSLSVIIQFSSYYLLSFNIDYSEMLGGINSRTSYSNGAFRPSGLTAEPSIISGIIVSLLTIYYLIKPKLDVYYFIGAISCFLTLSTLGIILISLYLTIILFKKNNLPIFILFLCPLLLISIPEILERYDIFQSGLDSSNNIKFEIIKNLLSSEHLLYFGYGLTGKSISAPLFYEALYDLTIFGSFFVIFGVPIGILLVITFLIFLAHINFNFKEKSLILLCFMKISSPTFIFFNLFIILIIIISQKNAKKYE
ncbi:hypothetical protein PROVRUST_08216 [Providencia rustigianii DSM 4541]|uniref:O-antigen polymerase n=1 Tax=Providencia rustigianii DSM 4541 TaxID=500637 RepID=D1P7J5_9GAMM|nr:hypothetical protein [Providencia rustigianii]EFB70735.1 hypothetical protein PROVRUST_08216 [Providencia rustigianii DSM 4541]SUC29050.1 Uncharacterised protein [Providencia rustigianii]